jgi:mannose/cellobiose epimerase-like protein (N-acyl-D-glucosamine 2-epimerase family)
MLSKTNVGHRLTALAATLALFSGLYVFGQQSTSNDLMKRAPASEIKQHIDREWLRKSMLELNGHWVEASVAPNGFIQENLDREWKPYGTQREATMNGQGRQLYAMMVAYQFSKDKRFLDAFNKGSEFIKKMHDDKYGGYFTRVNPDLSVVSDSKDSSVSFLVFSQAHAYIVTHDPKYLKLAMDTWHEIKNKMMKHGPPGTTNRTFDGPGVGGFGRIGSNGRAGSGRAGRGALAGTGRGAAFGRAGGAPPPAGERQVDLHTYEAMMVLYEASGSKEVYADLQHQWDLIDKNYNYEIGYLPEGFGRGPGPNGVLSFNTGHLFEWAWMFSRSVELGAPAKFLEMGNRELNLGLKVAFNPEGGIWMNADINGKVARPYMIWWNQAEILRATAHYAILHGRSDLWPYFDKSLAFLKANFMDPKYGGWYEGFTPGSPREALGERAYIKGAVDGPEFGSYHQSSMYQDLLRITEPGYRYPAKIVQH